MTDQCSNRSMGDKLMAYELGMLNDKDVREFEVHLVECAYCSRRALEFQKTAALLTDDSDVQDEIGSIASTETAEGKIDSARLKKVLRFALGFATLLAVILLLILKPWRLEFEPSHEAIAAQNRLLVTYFDNLADHEDAQRIGEIATNLLITDLSESQYISVVSSQRLYDILKLMGREGEKDVDRHSASEVASIAKADWLLMGSVLRVEPVLVVSTQLIDTETGNVVVSHRVEGDQDEDIFAVVDSLTVRIKTDMSLPDAAFLEPDRPVCEVTTCSPDAYRYYLEGIELLNKYYHSEAEQNFRKAIDADSTFAMAYYYLAQLSDYRYIEDAVRQLDNVSQKEKYYIRSRHASYNRDLPEAIKELRELLEHYPDEKRALYLIGTFQYSLAVYDSAAHYCRQAVQIDPLYKTALNLLAYTYNAMGESDSAIAAINRYITVVPDEANPYDSRGDLYASQGEIDKAAESYRMALERKPDFAASVMKLGNIYLKLRQYTRAESVYTSMQGSSLKVNRADSRYLLAIIPLHQGRLAESLKLLDECIQTDSLEIEDNTVFTSVASKRFTRSRIFRALGMHDSSLAEIRQCVRLYRISYPTDFSSYNYLLAQQLAETGYIDEARAALDELEDVSATGTYGKFAYLYARSSIELTDGNIDSAAAYATECSETMDDFLSMKLLAEVLITKGDYEGAAVVFERILSEDTYWRASYGAGFALTYFALAEVYERLGRFQKAAENYEEFLQIWTNGDSGIVEIDSAKARLLRLRDAP